ncbi:MAG TPA: lysylphosphatidylglycerol synthase domain-containing protein [Wenzhouxiangellaceae bacterium]|nr:lysylphosphatidylglycerol synthase domain-containing protein [Wenzhouxiangellaceae bacterium]
MQVSSERLKRAMKWVGAALAAAAVAFVFHRLWTQFSALPADALAAAGPGLVMASLGYAGCGVFLALIWWLALRAAGFRSASFSRASSAFLSSQLGKYLPGNVGHFAARHALSRRHGISHRALVAATLLEALLLVVAAGVLSILVIQPMISGGLEPMLEVVWLVPLAAALVLAIGLAVTRRRGWLDSDLGLPRLVLELGAALCLALVFFLASSGCFVLMSHPLGTGDWMSLVPWVAAAWLLGFLVPGAPGGLGIREFVLVLGLTPLIGEAQAALDALMFRLVTISGDALMSAIGSAWLRKQSTGPTGR